MGANVVKEGVDEHRLVQAVVDDVVPKLSIVVL